MEADTISKHGQNPKRHTSRRIQNTDRYMKKLFITVIALAFMLGITSCKKECECTITSRDGKSKYTESYHVNSRNECKGDELYYQILFEGTAKCRYK